MTIKIAKKIVKYRVQKPDDKPAQAKPALVVDPARNSRTRTAAPPKSSACTRRSSARRC